MQYISVVISHSIKGMIELNLDSVYTGDKRKDPNGADPKLL